MYMPQTRDTPSHAPAARRAETAGAFHWRWSLQVGLHSLHVRHGDCHMPGGRTSTRVDHMHMRCRKHLGILRDLAAGTAGRPLKIWISGS
jgi:hypothetical protein